MNIDLSNLKQNALQLTELVVLYEVAPTVGKYLDKNDGYFQFGTEGFRACWGASIFCHLSLNDNYDHLDFESVREAISEAFFPYYRAGFTVFDKESDRQWAFSLISLLIKNKYFDFPFYEDYMFENFYKSSKETQKIFNKYAYSKIKSGEASNELESFMTNRLRIQNLKNPKSN